MADRHVLDASAVLRLLDDGPGAGRVAEVLDTASISSISIALVAAELTKRGAEPHEVSALLRDLHLNVVAFSFDQAIHTGTFGPTVSDRDADVEQWAWLTLASQTGATGITGELPTIATSEPEVAGEERTE